MEGRSAAVVAPSCGERGTLLTAGQDSPRGGGGVVEWGLAHQGGAPETKRSHPGWVQ